MRLLVVTCALSFGAASAVLACGGGTPPPSDESEAANAATKATEPATKAEPTKDADTAPAASASPAPASAQGTNDAPAGADDPWMASHQMTPKDVFKAMKPAQAKAQACFRAGVKRDPSTNGEVKIKFVITNDGVVRVWKDDGSSMTDEVVTQCVGDLLKSLKFPKQKSPGDAYGVYSINFTE
jgi:hypothetical protein